jgi:hypothetical protein
MSITPKPAVPSFPKKASYFTHGRLEVKPTIRTYVALNGMVSTLPLLKQLVLTILSTLAAKWTHLHRLRLELRWCVSAFCTELQQRKAAGHTSRVPGCASSSVPTPSARELLRTRDQGSCGRWRVRSKSVRENETMYRGSKTQCWMKKFHPQSCGGSISIEDVCKTSRTEKDCSLEGSIAIRIEAGAKENSTHRRDYSARQIQRSQVELCVELYPVYA